MKLQTFAAGILFASSTLAGVVKREAEFAKGQPIDGKGKGAPLLGKIESPRSLPTDTDKMMQVEPTAKLTLPTHRT